MLRSGCELLLRQLDSSCCRCGSCCWFLLASAGLASDGFCCLLLACACSCRLLPAPAGFCLLLLASAGFCVLLLVSACYWIFFFGWYPGEARSFEKGCVRECSILRFTEHKQPTHCITVFKGVMQSFAIYSYRNVPNEYKWLLTCAQTMATNSLTTGPSLSTLLIISTPETSVSQVLKLQ